MKQTVIAKQNLLDLALQECGDVRAVFDIALANNISVTDVLFAGMELTIPESEFTQTQIRNYYLGKGRRVATEYTSEQIAPIPEGIGYWMINIDFIVQ